MTVRIPGTIRASLAAATLTLAGFLGMAVPALATHQPTAEAVVAIATGTPWNMSCQPGSGSMSCTAADFDGTWFEDAGIQPASGPLSGVRTEVTVFSLPLDPFFRSWHQALQAVGCAPDRVSAGQLSTFLATVTGRREAGTDGPITIADECTLVGGLRITTDGSVTDYTYWIQSGVVVPPVVATPTPRPTRRPTPRPTPQPTPAPTPIVSHSPTAAASSTASPSASPTAAATPEQSVLAGNPSPTSSAAAVGAPTGPPASRPPPGALVASVTPLAEVNFDPVTVGGSAGLAIALVLFMAFTGELFNDTFEANYEEIAGWLHLGRRGAGSRAGRFTRLWASPVGIGLFLAAGAAVYLLLDPALTLGADSIAVYLGMLAGLGVVLVAFEAPGLFIYRRRTGASPGVRALPWTLPAAVVCVAISRMAGLEPGYLYGIVIGLVFSGEVSPRDEGRQNAAGAAWTLFVALMAWIGLDWVRAGDASLASFASLLLETGLAVVVVGGLEAVAFGLLPMRFLAGDTVYAWSRWRWALIYGLAAFAFIHLLIGPHTGYLSELSPAALAAALGAFAAFGAFSVLFWAYFRFRPSRA